MTKLGHHVSLRELHQQFGTDEFTYEIFLTQVRALLASGRAVWNEGGRRGSIPKRWSYAENMLKNDKSGMFNTALDKIEETVRVWRTLDC